MNPASEEVPIDWAPPARLAAHWPESQTNWNLLEGKAELSIAKTRPWPEIRWIFSPPRPKSPELNANLLMPEENLPWLAQRLRQGSPPDQSMIPLPLIPTVSNEYPHLVNFLKEMTANHFNSTICHWPEIPIPVRAGRASNGQLNLSRCLREAVARWNQGEPHPWFKLDENAEWGVRLVHFPQATLRPPLMARITRLDDQGRPLRMNIIAGANYDGPEDEPYAIRGMVHELSHALFLWGHSRDRQHVLWESGPPLVEFPSEDERKAAHLWHGLPEGLDLNDYFSEY